MATTSLRTYLQDIEAMIDAGQTDEAIAHCRHILQTFPKSIGVYRLLGKAYLESQRYSDAADVLQRVLSTVPDDFVSHVGMSIIREDEGNLDASIWHMERAFEGQPYNSAIQDELRRLYGRRDGMEPPKMRLTRGALARMYIKGNLYQQAIGELRAALAEDPQRPDLQALLARVYYLTGQRVETVEACSALLKKLPYCLEANILLGAILPETERAQDAQNYRQRASALDPYFSKASATALTADDLPANAINIERLSYTPGASAGPVEGQPAWATSLGVNFNESQEGSSLPDWLAPASEGQAKPEDETTTENSTSEAFPWEASTAEAAPTTAESTDADAIPDWMKEAGWTPSTGAAQEGPMPFDLEEDEAKPSEDGELAPADIPDWLRDAAPPGALDQAETPTADTSDFDELPWLQETAPGASDTIATWLSETQPVSPQSTEDTGSELPADLIQELEGEGAGTSDSGDENQAELADLPDWLKDNAPPSQAQPPSEVTEEESIPDWMQTAAASETGSSDELPDWLQEVDSGAPAEAGELPDWLEANAPVSQESPQPPAPEETTPSTAEETEETPTIDETPAEEFPSWLKEVESEIPEDAVESPQVKGVTDWLQNVNTGDLNTGPVGITDWLNQVEPGQEPPASESEAAPADEVPEWLKGIMEAKETDEAQPQEVESSEPAPSAEIEETPDRLKEPEAEVPEEITPEAEMPTAAEATEAEEVPEWLKEVEAEVPEETAPTAETVSPEAAPTVEGELPEGLDLSDQEASLAWLESLAARQGAPEEELISKPEAHLEQPSTPEAEIAEPAPAAEAEEIPDWLKEAEAPEEIAPEAETPAAVEAAEAEEVPDWLKEVEAEVPEETAPEAEMPATLEATEAGEVPDWLKEVEAEVPEEIAPEAEMPAPAEAAEATPTAEGGLPEGLDLSDQEASLAWLESLAAKQGAPEEELISKPEAHLEQPPTPEAEITEPTPAAEAEVPEGIAPKAEIPEATEAEEIPDWLKEVEAEAPEEIIPEAEIPAAAEAAEAEEVPDWLKEPEAEVPGKAAPEAEIPAPAEAAEAEEIPDWLKEVEAEVPEEIAPEAETPAPAEAAEAEEVPEWLKEVEAEVPEEAAPTAEAVSPEAAPTAEGGLPEGLDLSDQEASMAWLESLAARQGAPEEELISKPEAHLEQPPTPEAEIAEPAPAAEAEAPEEITPETEMPTAVEAEEVPDWLKEVEAEVPEETTPEAEMPVTVEAEEIPEWLKEAEVPEEATPTAETVAPEAAPTAEGELPEGLDLSDQEASLAWLESLAARQGAPEEELISKSEAHLEQPPTPEAEVPEEIAPETEMPEAAEAEEIPDWLKEVAAEAPEGITPEAGVPAAVEAAEAEEIPDWLKTEAEELTSTSEVEPTAEPVIEQEITPPASEWLKETELPQWQEQAETGEPEQKPEPEGELPGWLADAEAEDKELGWVPPEFTEREEQVPAKELTNLNSASVGELESLPGIGFVLAQSIMNYRDAHGPFTQIEQLLDVPGISQGTIDVLKAWVTVEPVTEETPLPMDTTPLDPDHLILRKAQNALQEGDTAAAVKQFELLLKKLVLLNEIILDLQDALYRYPVDIAIWQTLGDAYMRNNQLQDALDAYTKAEELLR